MWTLNLNETRQLSGSDEGRCLDRQFLVNDRVWFRFRENAGVTLANHCNACGRITKGSESFWSNGPYPTQVGDTAEIAIYQGCNPLPQDTYRGLATRCSEGRGGLVFKIVDAITNCGTFCGSK